jgi:hypothetical protein
MRAHHALAARASLPSLRALVSPRRAAASRPLATRTSTTMAQATPKLKLIYFPVKARAEPTRLALHIAGIPFQDVRIQHADWPAMKEKMPFHTLPARARAPASLLLHASLVPPRSLITARAHTYICAQVLEVDGEQLGQSYAILMYAGRLAKLVPEDALEAAKARGDNRIASHHPLLTRAHHAGEQVEQVLFHLIDLDTLLAPSNKEENAAKKVALREELAHGPLLTWFGALEV